jgi:hypothetical protein
VIDSSDISEPFSEIESMVRSAADYVQVSKDLRPRVMEAARLTNGERRIRRHIRQVALMAALLTWVVTASVSRLDMRDDLRELSLATTSAYPISHAQFSSGAADVGWVLVDAYTDLRGRQADVLRLKL